MMKLYTNKPTLQDGYTRWLDAEHPRKPELKNRDREDNDLKNHDRALRCFVAAVGDGEDDLANLPLSLLQISDALVARQVREGARLLAEQGRKAVPGDKTLSNLVSCLKAIRKVALEGLAPRQTITQVLAEQVKPKRRARPSFPSDGWPQVLKDEWQGFLAWKTADFLPPNEERFRKKRVRQSSCRAYLRKTNVYIGWFVRELGQSELTLEDLCDLDNYTAFLNWYLAQEAGGGYASAKETGVTLATISQYLVAKGRLPEEHTDGGKLWDAFYARAYKAMELGADRGVIDEVKEIGDWKPWHLAELAEAIWNSEPIHSGAPHGQRHRHQLICRKRTALLFRMGMETPLRIRNWSEMRWGKNLFKNKRGQWIVCFKGEELKVGRRELKTNVYERTYSDEAGKWVERWRSVLGARLGPDFETQCPYVFPKGNLDGKRCAEDSLRRQMDGLSQETIGKPFQPHRLRYIVASHVVNELGPCGLKLAAELLGDTVNVILNAYYRPNTAEAFQNYLTVCSQNKQKRY